MKEKKVRGKQSKREETILLLPFSMLNLGISAPRSTFPPSEELKGFPVWLQRESVSQGEEQKDHIIVRNFKIARS